jgi:hypothetical protein
MGALAVLGSTGVEAQNVESIMQARERLELTDDQNETLDNIRREAVQERTAQMAQMEELRSQLDAGQIRQSEMMAFMEELQDARQGVAEQRRERIESALTESQLEMVQATRRGAGRARVGRGGRAGPGGQGFGPRGRAGALGPQGFPGRRARAFFRDRSPRRGPGGAGGQAFGPPPGRG